MSSPAPFNWSSLIAPAAAAGSSLGATVVNNLLPSSLSKQSQAFGQAATNTQLGNDQANTGFNQQLSLNQLANQNQVRQNVLPGMYQTLGYSPTDAAAKASSFGTVAPLPTAVPTPAALPTPTTSATAAHTTANDWVQTKQNPFDSQMAATQDPAAKKTLAQQYLKDLTAFMGQGPNENKVGQQAMATFKQYYGDPSQYA